jgi:hypothetical protein
MVKYVAPPMTLETYRSYADAIGYGKRLPEAVYIVRPQQKNIPVELWKIICRAEIAAKPDPSWNLLKVRALQNRDKNGNEFVAFIRSAPASLSATLAALPCMSLIPVAPFLPDG